MARTVRIMGFVLAALVTIVAHVRPAFAEDGAGRTAVYARVGAVTEGMQGTFRRGLELGLGVELKRDAGLAFGLGAGFARQPNQFDYDEFELRALSFEGHMRWAIGEKRVRPMVELGLGYYRFHLHSLWRIGQPASDTDWTAPGGWLGLGAEGRITEGVSARVGVAYHFVAQSIAFEGGNLEDYVASGLTLEYALP